jgi:mannan endo-1,4-beta-mannosidase
LYFYNIIGGFKNCEEYPERYPGDDFADVMSFDTYQYNDPLKDNSFIQSTQ